MINGVGYPVHAVREYREWQNDSRARFTDWKAACGASDTATGWFRDAFKSPLSARRTELCPACWPDGHNTRHDPPRLMNADRSGMTPKETQ